MNKLFLLFVLLLTSGCFRTPAQRRASAEKRQAQAIADREEELQFRDESGNMDWRARVDAAQKVLEQAQSSRRWGQSQTALDQALDAARLMPPPGKDFDLQTKLEELQGDSGGAAGDTATDAAGGGTAGTGETGGAGAEAAEEGSSPKNRVTNAEVRRMRKALEELLQDLEGSTGRTNAELSLERDLIEIQ